MQTKKSAKQYHTDMSRIFSSVSTNPKANIDRHQAHLDRLAKEKADKDLAKAKDEEVHIKEELDTE